MPHSPAATALALLAVPGVGRVTAHRLRSHFPTVEALRATPREQVLLRIRRSPRAADLVERLLDDAVLDPLLASAEAEVSGLAQRGVTVLCDQHPEWPTALDALDAAARPVVLYTYGPLNALAQPSVAFLSHPPLPGPAFEQAQAVARQALARGLGLVVGAANGFDLALIKLAVDARIPSVAVLGCGLAKLTSSFRPAATALVRAGGLLLSPFDMDHGPFEHDEGERATVQAALGRAVCAVALPADSHEAHAIGRMAKRGASGPTLACIDPAADSAWASSATHLDDAASARALLDSLAP